MSRFTGFQQFYGGGDSDSDSDKTSKESDDEQPQKTITTGGKPGKIIMSDASSDEEERKIRSGKTKRLEALEKVIDSARKHANIQDFEKLQEDFDKLVQEIKNQSKTLYEEYEDNLPKRVLNILMQIEE